MVREVTGGELHEAVCDSFVAHQVDPERTHRAWVTGDAVVIDGALGRPGERMLGPVYTCLGPVPDLAPLVAEVAELAPDPWRVTVERALEDLPDRWHRPAPREWHWMLTDIAVPQPAGWQVEQLDAVRDAVEIDDVLDDSNADSYARPGVSDVVAWLGIRERARGASRLLAAGALQRMYDGTLHLRGIGVRPETRGNGAGTTLSAALTNQALAQGSGVATLAVYTHNTVAVEMYERLGYRVLHTFTSGEVAP